MAGSLARFLRSSKVHRCCDQYWQATACLSHHGIQSSNELHQPSISLHRHSSQLCNSSLSNSHTLLYSTSNSISLTTSRMYSTPQRSNSFFGKILDNLKEESQRNSNMKKSIEEFKKEMNEYGKTETATKARDKFNKIEEETAEGTRKARKKMQQVKQKISKTVEEAQNIEMLQKASKITGDATEKVRQNISQKGEELSQSETYKAIKEEVQASRILGAGARVYRRPEVLRMRTERNPEAEQRIMEANTEATGVVLHKDSRFSQSWQEFRDNNPYVNKVLDWKTRLDESDHFVVRASSLVKDKVTELFGPVFHQTDLSKTLTEICRMDPDFNKDTFLLEVEYDFIPNILEAMVRPELQVLKDWTYERAYAFVATEANQNSTLGHTKETQVLDIDHVDLAMGKVLDEGPVLAVTFQAQVIECTRNTRTREIIEGDDSTTLRRHYVWVFCRDQTEINPRAAWKLLEFTYHSAAQLV